MEGFMASPHGAEEHGRRARAHAYPRRIRNIWLKIIKGILTANPQGKFRTGNSRLSFQHQGFSGKIFIWHFQSK
jgi:hypothetical protein